jgi:signal transduction histidine kinase
VQEALTNVHRHAGSARTAVELEVTGESVVVSVRNAIAKLAGRREGGGRGLAGIGERVRLLGGTLEAGPDADGWVLRAVVPTGGRL